MNNVVAFLVFYIVAELLVISLQQNKDINIHLLIGSLGILFVVILMTANKLVKPDTKDNYQDFEPSLRSVCKGGKYMWQGDTPLDRACRAMYDNPALEKTIRNPDTTYMRGAKPYADFEFDPIINDNFEFVRCANK